MKPSEMPDSRPTTRFHTGVGKAQVMGESPYLVDITLRANSRTRNGVREQAFYLKLGDCSYRLHPPAARRLVRALTDALEI